MLTPPSPIPAPAEAKRPGEPLTHSEPLTYNSVYTQDTVGVAFLGFFALVLLIALLRAEARFRAKEKGKC